MANIGINLAVFVDPPKSQTLSLHIIKTLETQKISQPEDSQVNTIEYG